MGRADVSYQCKFEKGERIIENHQMKVIMDKDDQQYFVKDGDGGRLKWRDAMEVDSQAKKYEPR